MTTMYTETSTLHSLPIPDQEFRVIGMHGFAQTGKDTVAKILADHGYKRIAFADPIRDALYTLNPIVATDNQGRKFGLAEVVDAEGWEDAKKNHEVRRLLQVFGAEVGREMFGTNVWTDKALRKFGSRGKYIVTDVRFENEVKMIRQIGGTLVKITRPGYHPVNSHVSDSGLPDFMFDLHIRNDGTLEDLQQAVLAQIVGR